MKTSELPRNVRTNPVKTQASSPIFHPNCRAAVKSMGMPRTEISKSETLREMSRKLNSVCS